jgi:protein-S-isoprenylcysteine O-methyltransferase Ste14
VLQWAGVGRPATLRGPQIVALVVGALGAAVALWCVVAFALVGRGTPAPFDPPRRLVVRGPYRRVRNPMYLGAAVALGAAALFYESLALLGFTALFLLMTHLFVVGCEEPALRGSFGAEYDAYCREVRRWWPKLR